MVTASPKTEARPRSRRRVKRVLEQPAEDTEAAIGGVDDCSTCLGRGDTSERHQRVMPDYSPLVDGDRRQQLARRERRHQVPRPVEVGVHIAQVVVLVEELGDRLAVLGRSRPHLDRVGRFYTGLCAPRAQPRCGAASPVRRHARADGHFCRQPLPVRTEVHQQHVPGVRSESGERLRQRPEVALRRSSAAGPSRARPLARIRRPTRASPRSRRGRRPGTRCQA